MGDKLNTIIITSFAVLATWIILAAMPYFRLTGMIPQVDSQIIFLHGLCGLMYFYLALRFLLDKNILIRFNSPLILIPLLLAILGIIAGLLGKNLNLSFSGSPQIGQGVFWYFDLVIMSLLFSQVAYLKNIRFILFLNLLLITSFVTLFTFYPYWKGFFISFYYFTDYLCFYGVLVFIMITTLTKHHFISILSFLLLGYYFSLLDNNSALLTWGTSLAVGATYYFLLLFRKYSFAEHLKRFLFSELMFVFIIFLFSFLTVFSSLYFWSNDYNLASNIKDTPFGSLIVRGKIIENSLYSLDNLKNLIFGTGWGMIPDLLLENMSSWQYDELRLGYNLHFHTHNELAEHIISVGLIGGILFLLYIYYIFKEANNFSFLSKLGWLLFFKITCFWFLWTGTMSLFAIVLSVFISVKPLSKVKINLLKNLNIRQQIIFSLFSVGIGFFLFYGAHITYSTTKVYPKISYAKIIEYLNEKEKVNNDDSCLEFYNDSSRGGYMLGRFLDGYSSYVLTVGDNELSQEMLNVLEEMQCKANYLIENNQASSSLLSTSMLIDAKYYYRLGETKLGKEYFKENYKNWYNKALKMSKELPKRGDLLFPYLSYAINNNKSDDAAVICESRAKGIEAFCDLIFAYQLLKSNNIDEQIIEESISLVKKSIEKGIFNELLYGFWFKEVNNNKTEYDYYGIHGIPLAPDILFLISDNEKYELEKLIN